jgi:hypothetical protein
VSTSDDGPAAAADPLDAIREQLAGPDPMAGFARLRGMLSYPSGLALEADRLAAALGLLGDAAHLLGHPPLGDACRRLAADIDDPDRMYELGYQLIEYHLPAVAATVLRRCYDAVGGSEQVVTELVAALESMMAYAEAAAFLRDQKLVETSFMCRYLYAFNSVLSGDLATARELFPRLEPTNDAQELMARRIAGFLDRAERAARVTSLGDRDLRGWHYVVTGGILTHLSPYGFDGPMHGRYAWLQDSPERIAAGIELLARVLAAWGVAPPCVYAVPGASHEVVATAVSLKLGLPLAPWPVIGTPAPGLVVAHDAGAIDAQDAKRLWEIREGQVFYAHASPWGVDGFVAPDVTTLLCQTLVAPWEPRVAVGAGGDVVTRPADARTAADIAADVVGAAALPAEDSASDDLAGLDRLVAATGAPAAGRRERLWGGSPVPSNRFL